MLLVDVGGRRWISLKMHEHQVVVVVAELPILFEAPVGALYMADIRQG